MKTVFQLLLFIFLANMLVGIVISSYYDINGSDLTKTQEMIDRSEVMIASYEELEILSQQRDLGTDTGNPINVWSMSQNFGDMLQAGITFPLKNFDSEIESVFEKMIIWALRIWILLIDLLIIYAFIAVFITKSTRLD